MTIVNLFFSWLHVFCNHFPLLVYHNKLYPSQHTVHISAFSPPYPAPSGYYGRHPPPSLIITAYDGQGTVLDILGSLKMNKMDSCSQGLCTERCSELRLFEKVEGIRGTRSQTGWGGEPSVCSAGVVGPLEDFESGDCDVWEGEPGQQDAEWGRGSYSGRWTWAPSSSSAWSLGGPLRHSVEHSSPI